jgi:FixJ family two-component response regulator
VLRHLGYDSLLFPSAEAVAAHRGFDKALCVLLDINLGAVSGTELKKRFDAEGIKVPVVFMTGSDSPPFVRQHCNRGVSPISLNRFPRPH